MDDLIKVAQKMALRNRKGFKGNLSGLMVMTDAKRLPDPCRIIPKLPAGSIVILRAYLESQKAKLINKNKLLCKKHHVLLFVSRSFYLAKKNRIDGVHVPEKNLLKSSFKSYQRNSNLIISAACHSRAALINGHKSGADLLTLSPVFPTKSHPDRKNLDLKKCQRNLRTVYRTPVYALGGITNKNINDLINMKFSGIAGISIFR